jgi:hypothetical protein
MVSALSSFNTLDTDVVFPSVLLSRRFIVCNIVASIEKSN